MSIIHILVDKKTTSLNLEYDFLDNFANFDHSVLAAVQLMRETKLD